MHTTMRSQDLWLGFPYDIFTATLIQELLAGWLEVGVGEYHHHVDSLHLYEAAQRRLVAEQRWLIEGNYAGTLPIRLARADTVVFLDLPAITCLYGITQPRWRYRGGQHGDGVYDRITWNFIKYIWGYRKTMRPKVEGLLAEHGGHVHLHMLTSRRQAARYVRALQAEQSTRI